MNKYIIGLIFMISPLFLLGHNPLSAKYYFEAGERVSLLNINLSQKGVEQTLLKKYSKDVLNRMDQKQYKELIVEYIKNNFHFSVDNTKIELTEGGIKLGDHQTDLKFVLPPLPKEIEKFEIHIPAFIENENHQTIFSYNMFGKVNKIILQTSNNYKSTIKLDEQVSNSYTLLWAVLGSLSLLTLAIFVSSKK